MANLKWTSEGPKIKELQQKLGKLGIKPKLKPDGKFGELTYKAVKAFQAGYKGEPKLKSDGVAGSKTISAIDTALKGGGGATIKWPEDLEDYPQQKKDLITGRREDAQSQAKYRDALSMAGSADLDKLEAEWEKLISTYEVNIKKYVPLVDQIAKLKKQFDTQVTKAPDKAKATVKQAMGLHKQAEPLSKIWNDAAFKSMEIEDQIDAALKKLGGAPAKPLKWTLPDYAALVDRERVARRSAQEFGEKIQRQCSRSQAAVAAAMGQAIVEAEKTCARAYTSWEAPARQIASHQGGFEDHKSRNPGSAAALLREAQKLEPKAKKAHKALVDATQRLRETIAEAEEAVSDTRERSR